MTHNDIDHWTIPARGSLSDSRSSLVALQSPAAPAFRTTATP